MAYYGYGGFGPYVSVAEKKHKAAQQVAKLRKKGKNVQPIEAFTDRKIAHSFWGQSWCDNMERYADYENRLPRGKSYLRHGCVCDLQIAKGEVTALVSGTSLYKVHITIDPLSPERTRQLTELLHGKISSQLDLLQGKIPKDVKELVGNPNNGIIPFPKEIHIDCSCPDWATLCKHAASVLYGIGRRLDTDPGVLFTLRGLDPALLCARASDIDFTVDDSAESLSGSEDLGALFGIDLETGDGGGDVLAAALGSPAQENSAQGNSAQGAAPAQAEAAGKAVDKKAPKASGPSAQAGASATKSGTAGTTLSKSALQKAKAQAKASAATGKKATAQGKAAGSSKAASAAASDKSAKAAGPFDPEHPTAEGIQALYELSGLTPKELCREMRVSITILNIWLAKKGPLNLMDKSVRKIEAYQKKLLKQKK